MNKFTGDRNTDFIILQQLNDYELGQVCKVNKFVKSLCNDENFWINRLTYTFKNLNVEEIRKFKKFFGYDTYKELYIFLKTFPDELFEYGLHKKVDRIDVINLLKKTDLIDELINTNLKEDLPIWVDKEKLFYDVRRRFPTFIVRNSGYRAPGNTLSTKIYHYLSKVISFHIPGITGDQFNL